MNEPTQETVYDRSLRQARQLEVREDHTRKAVADVLRAARLADLAASASGRRWRWLAPALGAAIASIAVVIAAVTLDSSSPRPDATLMTGSTSGMVQVGPRVALFPAPGATYALRSTDRHETRLEVLAGAVTVRLVPGSEPHELLVAAGGLIARAQGTIYTVGYPPGGPPYAVVHEGTVAVHTPRGDHTVSAGDSWPPDHHTSQHALQAADALARFEIRTDGVDWPAVAEPPQVAPPATDADASSGLPSAPPDPGQDASRASPGAVRALPRDSNAPVAPGPGSSADTARGERAAAPPDHGSNAATDAAPSPALLWRRARLFRGQGRYRDALDILEQLAAGADATWAPLASIEMMRLHGEDLVMPARVIELGDAFLRAYPGHDLRTEVVALYCAAHRQRGGDVPLVCR